ncbi:MAG: hypothetical protein ACRC33_29080 [Gemmataceae bacterium]
MKTAPWLLAALLLPTPAPAAEPTDDKAKQAQLQAETDRLVLRIETMIRVMRYNRLERTAEKKLLDQVHGMLDGLSREQMAAVVAALDRAGALKGEARDTELKAARDRHAEVVLGLKAVLAKFDAVKTLDQAADRLDKMARDTNDQLMRLMQALTESEGMEGSGRKVQSILTRIDGLVNDTAFVKKDFDDLTKQVETLVAVLPAEQKDRADKFKASLAASRPEKSFQAAADGMRHGMHAGNRRDVWRKAGEAQAKLASELRGFARVLRPLPDRMAAVREASVQLGKVIDEQAALRVEAMTPPPKREGGDAVRDERPLRGGFGRRVEPAVPEDPAVARGREMADKQGWAEFDTHTTRGNLALHLAEVAGGLGSAEKAMGEAQWWLRARSPFADVVGAHGVALTHLRAVKAELDRLIARDDLVRNDPLENVKDALAQVEKLLADQKELKATAEQTKDAAQLPKLAPKQAELARTADAVKEQAAAAKPEAREALDRASRAMDEAAAKLAKADPKPAKAKQEESVKALEDAKRALADQAAEMEARRAEIAKLEEAAKKLDEILAKEKGIADDAKKPDGGPKARELAKKQEAVTPPTKEVAKDVKEAAPEAAKKIDAAAKAMEGAKKDLDETKPAEGAKKADDAVAKLGEAKEALDKALADRKADDASAVIPPTTSASSKIAASS